MSIEPPAVPPSIPPTTPFATQPPVPVSIWPTVVGIIAIVFAILGVLQGAGSIAGFLMMSRMTAFKTAMPPEVVKVMADMAPRMILISAGMMAVAVLLLIGGIGLLRRLPWSVALIHFWAVTKMLAAAAQTLLSYQMQEEQFRLMQGQGTPPAGVPTFVFSTPAVNAVLWMAWWWALPVFMLIWFARPRIKAEVQQWRAK